MKFGWRYALVAVALALPALAVDPGRADGALTIDRDRVQLVYAYAIGHQKNEITKRKDEVKVILTDKPLAADADLNEIESNFPEAMYGVIFNVASNKNVTHVSVLHPKGSYDGGYLEAAPDFRFQPGSSSRGAITGHISSNRVKTNTMTFSVDAEFSAVVR